MSGFRLLFLAILMVASGFGNCEEVSCRPVPAALKSCLVLALFDSRGWGRTRQSATSLMKKREGMIAHVLRLPFFKRLRTILPYLMNML
jgi:hypothetical protein